MLHPFYGGGNIAIFNFNKDMYHRSTGSYDEIPNGMKTYINNFGCHFNKKLCKEAVSRMTTRNKQSGKEEPIVPYTKEDVEGMLNTFNIKVRRNKLYDAVYVANMCKADFLGSSIPSEEHLCKYIKDVLDDIDADDGYVFNRFYADTIFMNNPIDWDDML